MTSSTTSTSASAQRRINLGRIRVLYNEDPPGSGKSTRLRRMMVCAPGRYLYAVPSVKHVEESAEAIRDIAAEVGASACTVIPLHSDMDLQKRTVSRALSDAVAATQPGSHLVIIITHVALFEVQDLSRFTGWKLFIDEVPGAVECGVFKTGSAASATILSTFYDIEPLEGGWSQLTMRKGTPTVSALERDTLLEPLAALHRRASGWLVLVDRTDWAEIGDGKGWSWCALWDFGRLTPFAEIRIVGNSLTASLSMQVVRSLDGEIGDLVFKPFSLKGSASSSGRLPRVVRIHYFSSQPGTVPFWKTSDGRRCIELVADWLKANAPSDLLWSANIEMAKLIKTRDLHGHQESPLLAGVNAYRHLTWAALIYSAKMLPEEKRALRIFKIDRDTVWRSREIEALIQFLFRTALREDASAAEIDFAVYDRRQAEAVASYLNEKQLGIASTIHHDVGVDAIMADKAKRTVPSKRSTRPTSPPMDAAQRQRNSRAKKRAEQAAKAAQTGGTTVSATPKP